jgi:hypothetical protein
MNHSSQRALVALGCCAVAVACWLGLSVEPSAAQPPPSDGTPAPPALGPAPAVALIATMPGADLSRLYVVGPGQALPPATLEFHHLPGGSVRAEVWSQAPVVLATARTTPGRDRSFDGGLYRLDPATGVKQLCTNLTHASRPLITPTGRVFVSRGTAGPPPASGGSLRVDELTIDEVDPQSGAVTTVHKSAGYLVHLAGWHDGRLLLYRLGPTLADLVALSPQTGKIEILLPALPPFARDFSVDPKASRLVYRNRHQSDARRWVVDTLDLTTRAQNRLYEGESFSLAPHVWPGGAVAFNPKRQGLRLQGTKDPIASPMGPGVDLIRSVSETERFVAALHTVQGRLPVPFVMDRHSGAMERLTTPSGSRVAIAGFVSTTGGTP